MFIKVELLEFIVYEEISYLCYVVYFYLDKVFVNNVKVIEKLLNGKNFIFNGR